MAVRIRLKRFGTKNRLQWRVVVSDVKMPRDGRFIEEIGYYDPLPIDEKFVIQKDRLDYWLGQGAQLSSSVRSLLKRANKKAKKTAKA
ncbi:MAG: 30S ribosomal protein S16 [Candidatus Omnitrophica bacterium]|nr:30S ribosomal protein S16 [Candidatus Omnitrophota bacterium]